MRKSSLLWIIVATTALLSGCAFSLVADVTPPPGYRPPPTTEPTAARAPASPLEPPNPAEGAAEIASLTPTAAADPQAVSLSLTEPAASGRTALVRGQVVNGSGSELPASLEVTLYGFESMSVVFSQTTTIGPAGFYTFTDVAMLDDRVYIAMTTHEDVLYGSTVASAPADEAPIELPITVYDTITDTSVLVVDRLHIFLEFNSPGRVRVVELYVISNPSAYTVTSAEPNGAVVKFDLPPGAENLEFQNGALGERYLATPHGFADTERVRPGSGEYQLLFAFELPYQRKLEWAQPMLPNTRHVTLMLPEAGVRLQSDQLQEGGTRQLQGITYHLYNGSDFGPQKPLAIALSGKPSVGRPTLSPDDRTSLLVGLGSLGIAFIVAGLWLYRRGRSRQAADALQPAVSANLADNAEVLMDAIIALDDQFRAGKLPEAAYRRQRQALKTRLKAMKSESGQEPGQ